MENVNIEELRKELRKTEEKIQDEFIDSLYDKVEFLCEKANKKSYEPTVQEKMTFEKIATIIESMAKWF